MDTTLIDFFPLPNGLNDELFYPATPLHLTYGSTVYCVDQADGLWKRHYLTNDGKTYEYVAKEVIAGHAKVRLLTFEIIETQGWKFINTEGKEDRQYTVHCFRKKNMKWDLLRDHKYFLLRWKPYHRVLEISNGGAWDGHHAYFDGYCCDLLTLYRISRCIDGLQ